ncbi:MAG: hypothetical protein ABW049_02735 [Spongiibacteraceae bacterium]
MLTQDAVRNRLDAIADEVSQEPGIYYELFSRLFSVRVHNWIRSVSSPDAALIARLAENDPDYLSDVDEVDLEISASIFQPALDNQREAIFNPDWDVSY